MPGFRLASPSCSTWITNRTNAFCAPRLPARKVLVAHRFRPVAGSRPAKTRNSQDVSPRCCSDPDTPPVCRMGKSVQMGNRTGLPGRLMASDLLLCGAPGRIRTCDARFRKPTLYPLSYGGLRCEAAEPTLLSTSRPRHDYRPSSHCVPWRIGPRLPAFPVGPAAMLDQAHGVPVIERPVPPNRVSHRLGEKRRPAVAGQHTTALAPPKYLRRRPHPLTQAVATPRDVGTPRPPHGMMSGTRTGGGRLNSRVEEVDAPVRPILNLVGLFPVVLLALMKIPLGFTGDQALFATAAVELHHGRTLYRDFWDIKQPGIYWFFGLARFLGRGPVPVHILEFVVILIGAVMLQRTTRSWFADARVSSVVPVLVYGPYLAVSGPLGTTQIEALMCTPLAVCLVTAFNQRKPRFFAAGLAGGVLLVLKLLFAPLVAVIAIGALCARPSDERTAAVAGRRALIFTLGAAIPPILALVWLLVDHVGFGLLWRTTVVYPRQFSGLHGTDLAKSLASRFVGTYSLTGPLALIAVISWRSVRRDLALTLLVMAGVAALIVVPQRWSTYQVYIEMLPIGLLAAFGVDVIAARSRCKRAEAAHGARRCGVPAAPRCGHPSRAVRRQRQTARHKPPGPDGQRPRTSTAGRRRDLRPDQRRGRRRPQCRRAGVDGVCAWQSALLRPPWCNAGDPYQWVGHRTDHAEDLVRAHPGT